MNAPLGLELALLALAWAVALALQPWRLLRPQRGQVPLATPLLGLSVLLASLWAWPGLAALPIPLHWSGAPLAALLVGWPLAVPIVTFAGLSTMASTGASFEQALSLVVNAGLAPATLVLLLGVAVRRGFGAHPAAFMLGRAFLVPMLALGACGLLAQGLGSASPGPAAELQRIAIILLALGEASWTCAIVSLLVACRPQWLATWSDRLYLGRPPLPHLRAGAPRR